MATALQPTLAQFHVAATQIETTGALRFNAAGTSLAVTRWERFQVAVSDFFSSKESVATRKAEVLTAFLEAVRREQGNFSLQLAEREVVSDGKRALKLDSRTVTTAIGRLNETWVVNERAIRQAAYGVPGHGMPSMPSLAEIVDPIAEKLLQQADAGGLLTKPELESLQRKYAGTTPKLPNQPDNEHLFRLSRAIEKRLRERLRTKVEQTDNAAPTLIANEILRNGQAVVRGILTREINRLAYGNACAKEPFDDAFQNAVMENNDLSQEVKRTLDSMRGAFRHIEAQTAQETFTVLRPGTIQVQRTRFLESIVAHTELLDRLAKLDIPDGPLKTDVIKTSLSLSSKTSEAYFTQLETFAQDIAQSLDRLPEADALAQQNALLALGATMKTRFADAGLKEPGAPDIANFSVLSADLHVARADQATQARLQKWMQESTTRTLQNKMIDFAADLASTNTDPERASNANHINQLLVSLSQASESLQDTQAATTDAKPTAPTEAKHVAQTIAAPTANAAKTTDAPVQQASAPAHREIEIAREAIVPPEDAGMPDATTAGVENPRSTRNDDASSTVRAASDPDRADDGRLLTPKHLAKLQASASAIQLTLSAPLSQPEAYGLNENFCSSLDKTLTALRMQNDGSAPLYRLDADEMTLDGRAIGQDVQRMLRTIADKLADKDVSNERQTFDMVDPWITSELNQRIHVHYNADHPFEKEAKATLSKSRGNRQPPTDATIRELFDVEVQMAKDEGLLNPKRMAELRRNLLDKALTHPQAVAAMMQLPLPEGVNRTAMFKACLALPTDNNLAGMKTFADRIGGFIGSLPTQTADADRAAFGELLDAVANTPAPDIDLGLRLFAARSDRETQTRMAVWLKVETDRSDNEPTNDPSGIFREIALKDIRSRFERIVENTGAA